MALSTLSPPPSSSLTSHSSATSLPKLFHSTTAISSSSTQLNCLSTSNSTTLTPSYHKWRTHVSFFTSFLKNNKIKNAKEIKEELLEAIEPLDRGAEATPEDQQIIDQIARKLEAVNPTKEPLKSDLLDGKWELIYTTSQSILQTKTSWTNANPGRRFRSCPDYGKKGAVCGFFCWEDPEMCPRARIVIPGLLRKLNGNEAEFMQIQKKQKKLVVLLVISWFLLSVSCCCWLVKIVTLV